jgi:hypothetical protein
MNFTCSTRNHLLQVSPESIISFIIGPSHSENHAHPRSSNLQASALLFVFDCENSDQRRIAISRLDSFLKGFRQK